VFGNIVFLIDILAWFTISVQYLLYALGLFQQHEYDNLRFLDWGIRQYGKISKFHELILVLLIILQILFLSAESRFYLGLANQILLLGVLGWSFFLIRKRVKLAVKPLVFTQRADRILAVSIAFILGETLLLVRAAGCNLDLEPSLPCGGNSQYFLLGLLLLGQILALNLILANLFLYPLDVLTREKYISSAREKLKSIDPVVIGITGSYGKTSTKQILFQMLSEKYDVLSTPKSFNTLMGICKVINESLEAKHRYFIVEMGTYKKGEIKTICELVKPQIGILTAVGPQHLERFHTLENIAQAKFELIEALPQNGVAVFNYDNTFCRQLACKTHVKTLGYGLEHPDDVDIFAQKISVDSHGTKFEVVYAAYPPRMVRMQLLGRHNVSNALGATLVALECGLTLEQASHTLAVIPPVEHRLQLTRTPQGITILDNAYSSNPVSAQLSFEVFKALECSGKKILVTPGFAELGKEQEEAHFILGQKAAEVSDLVFLIGDDQRVSPIVKGLLDRGFPQDQIHVHASLNDARKEMTELTEYGDLILLENDLPDVY
jgi:UDP-N-acetylmuramoyl-tripeptide--D-alanyl-D-alanine ligase